MQHLNLNMSTPITCCRLILLFGKPFGRRNHIFTSCEVTGSTYHEISRLIIIWIIHILKLWLSCCSGLITKSVFKRTQRKTNKLLRAGTMEHKELVPVRWEIVTSPPLSYFTNHDEGCGLIIWYWGKHPIPRGCGGGEWNLLAVEGVPGRHCERAVKRQCGLVSNFNG